MTDIDHQAHCNDWAAALRDSYEQTTGQMTDDDGGFCCLGVACDLAGVPFTYDPSWGWGVSVDLIDETEWGAIHLDEEKELPLATLGHMPSWLRRTLALTTAEENVLAALNDDGLSFDAIALLVELPYRERRRVLVSQDTARYWLNSRDY